MGTGNVFQLEYDHICELCRSYSRGNFKTGKNYSNPSFQSFQSSTRTRVIGAKICNLFEIDKADSQLGVL